uniref:Uncharacterized protein LOC114345594 n=1 Tax=Diabrotica virgifera virgifera TaxID=50390 RepID=A0A6P7H3B1_DIAVI
MKNRGEKRFKEVQVAILMETQENIKEKRKLQEEGNISPAKKFDNKAGKENLDYGPNISEVYLSDIELQKEIDVLCAGLQVTPEEQLSIANETIDQFENSVYISQRFKRLTASNFGDVIKRKSTTSCHNLVKKILNTSNTVEPRLSIRVPNQGYDG